MDVQVWYSTTCNLLAVPPTPHVPSQEEAIFKALSKVTKPKEFAVCIGWHISDVDFTRDAPFRVITLLDKEYDQIVRIRGT